MLKQIAALNPFAVAGAKRVVVQRGHGRQLAQRGERAAVAYRNLAGEQVDKVKRHQCLHQACFDRCTTTGLFTLQQRSNDSLDRCLAGAVGRDLHRGIHRPALVKLHIEGRHSPRLGSDQAFVAGQLCIRAVDAPA